MKLITGGAWQGQDVFARELYQKETGNTMPQIVDGANTSVLEWKTADIVENVHLWIARLLRENDKKGEKKAAPAEMQAQITQMIADTLRENPKVYFTVQELGCGVVPIDPFDRNWREMTGRVCCKIAEQAEEVYRMTCGIGVAIKTPESM